MATTITAERIDAELPQTQCGKCGHDGCRPYAVAIVEGEAINRCPPGGEATRDRLAKLTGQPPLELIEPAQTPLLAVIREAECIGCTKCIQACPVDAILGAAKQMHTVIEFECTGCELCVAPCPVDCIDLVEHPQWAGAENEVEQQRYLDWRAGNGRQRFEARKRRLAVKAEEKRRRRERRAAAARAPAEASTKAPAEVSNEAQPQPAAIDVTALKAQRATLTARRKRLQRQLDKADETQRPALLERLAGFDDQLAAIDRQLESTSSSRESAAPAHRHIAVAAAEQAMRKARQELAHFQRKGDQAGIAQAQDKIHEAERLLSLANQSPATSPADSAGNDHGTTS
ncbi:RnfABCDGE type electron transport complex subunit B [Salinicola sp. MIT1003]|uniref:RnfABCDGE type electron transport complex subunit B n=1 Tax=Salinicola sp. MIT1003 TaxID=1882734 RepID=UPI0008DD730D|nr:RnfABCDGE type electron transport complex subunit B [Salinicola sp. MIT1003]OHZ03871.1 electron transporter RnfB [Salinicola sp. MIT1003]